MAKTRSRRGADSAAFRSPQDADAPTARRQSRQALQALQEYGVEPGARVLCLCCGYGLQAEYLAKAGYRVVGVDIRCDSAILHEWNSRSAVMTPKSKGGRAGGRGTHEAAGSAGNSGGLRLICGDACRLPLRGRFDAALLLANSLSVFADSDDAVAVLQEVRRLVGRDGLLLLDNVCEHIWEEIAAGNYANGISEDGLWQMAWVPGRNVFALRYGNEVRPNQIRPRNGEMLYRAWSLDEFDLLCRLTGWQICSRRGRGGNCWQPRSVKQDNAICWCRWCLGGGCDGRRADKRQTSRLAGLIGRRKFLTLAAVFVRLCKGFRRRRPGRCDPGACV